MHTINHLSGEPMSQNRNVLVEAARIARGDIKPLTDLDATHFDALILPGGFGAAKNLSDFAVKGTQAQLQPDIKTACQQFATMAKPAGYMCIAPAMIPLIYNAGTKVTIGDDPETASAINMLGAEHVNCAVDDIVIDEQHKLVSTPAYMLAESILEADAGIEKLVKAIIKMC